MQLRALSAVERLDRAKEILREHGHYEWLTENGSLVILNNGIEFAATYLIMLVALFFIGAGRTLSVDDWIGRWRRLRGRDKQVGRDRLGLKRHGMGEDGLGQRRDHALGVTGIGQHHHAQTLLRQQHPLGGIAQAIAAMAHDTRGSRNALLLEEDAKPDAQPQIQRNLGILRLDHGLDQTRLNGLLALELTGTEQRDAQARHVHGAGLQALRGQIAQRQRREALAIAVAHGKGVIACWLGGESGLR